MLEKVFLLLLLLHVDHSCPPYLYEEWPKSHEMDLVKSQKVMVQVEGVVALIDEAVYWIRAFLDNHL